MVDGFRPLLDVRRREGNDIAHDRVEPTRLYEEVLDEDVISAK
jgi:hypothetical protein